MVMPQHQLWILQLSAPYEAVEFAIVAAVVLVLNFESRFVAADDQTVFVHFVVDVVFEQSELTKSGEMKFLLCWRVVEQLFGVVFLAVL